MRKRNGTALLAAAIVLMIPLLVWSYSSFPPLGKTGAPGEGTCADSGCHVGGLGGATVTVKSSTGAAITTYMPGVTQHLKVMIADSSASKWGYEVTAVEAASTSTGAGNFALVAGDTNSTVQSSSGKSYAEHVNDQSGTSASASYLIDWTPPASNVGNITLYFAGVAGLPTSTPPTSGDSVYTGTVTLTPVTPEVLTVTTGGSGTVTSMDGFINCGSTCSHTYLSTDVVTLNAAPAVGWSLSGWSGACSGTGSCVVNMTQAQSVTATFTQNTYLLSVFTSGSGTVTSMDGFINCGSTCSHSYFYSAGVTLNAAPATGWSFSGWSGACSGKSSCVVSMTQARSVTATFTQNTYLLSVSTSGSGTVTSMDGFINCGSTCSHTYLSNTGVTLNAAPATGWSFSGWSGACSGNSSCVVSMTKAQSVTATFTENTYLLSVSTSGSGAATSMDGFINCGSTCSHSYLYSTGVTLNAAPATGWSFSGWSGACTGTGSCVVSMTQARSVTATFTQLSYLLTVSKVPTGGTGGTVTSLDGFINCGSTCTFSYLSGTTVTLTATPAKGASFTSWSGCPSPSGNSCMLTMNSALTVTATFTVSSTTFLLTVSSVGKGTITSSDTFINCPGTCSHRYNASTAVTLTAAPSAGWALLGWNGCDMVTGATCKLAMNADRNAAATFTHPAQDFNGDLKTDILWRNNSTGDNAIWLMNSFSFVTAAPIYQIADVHWQIAGTGDFNGDGKADILWRNSSTGQNAIWLMNSFSIATAALIFQVADLHWQVVAVADFDGDGKADILWRNSVTGDNAIWLMNGTTLKTAQSIYAIPDVNWHVAGSGDFDGDGKADIFWRNHSTGQNAVWLMNGFTIASSALIYQVSDVNWQVAAIGDFNGDGKSDLLWFHKPSGNLAMWLMNGLTFSSAAALSQTVDPSWQVVRAGDFNGDGKADILWRNQVNGQNAVWLMNGATLVNGQLIYSVPDLNWQMH